MSLMRTYLISSARSNDSVWIIILSKKSCAFILCEVKKRWRESGRRVFLGVASARRASLSAFRRAASSNE